MMEMAKVTSKGQITIPISIRRRLGINEGDKLLFIDKPDGVMMVNPDMLSDDHADTSTQPAESAVPTPAVASMKKVVESPVPVAAAGPDDERAKAASEAAVSEAVPREAAVSEVAPREAAVSEAAPAPQEERRPVPLPVEEPEKPETQIGGINLGSLLDDIRSIGSNI